MTENPALKHWLKRAADLAAQLNELSDACVEELEAVEDDLNRIGVGVTVDIEPIDGRVFGYGKVGKAWCLTVRTAGADERQPLLNAPRADRVLARDLLPNIVFAITRQREEYIRRLGGHPCKEDDLEGDFERKLVQP